MTKVRALFDTVGYYVDDDPRPRYAIRGEEFELDGEQLKRHLEHGSVGPASDAVEERPAAAKPIGELSLPQLKKRAKELGVELPEKPTHDDYIRAITEHDPHAGQGSAPEVVPPIEPDAVAPGVDVDDLRTPALDPVGDGKKDQSELGDEGASATRKAVG